MTILVVGATGTTGKLLVEQLLQRGQKVKAVVRNRDSLPEGVLTHENLTVIQASVLDLSELELANHVKGCQAVASCLGHNLNFKGMFGHPRKLVTDATKRLCRAIRANEPQTPVRFVLMNTTGNRNRDLPEKRTLGETIVIGLVRLLVPPHVDNEQAADYLRTEIGSGDAVIEWCAVRPDSLTAQTEVSAYHVHPSPVRSPIFNAGKTSRINVGHFMCELITDDDTWTKWKGQMPVIYNEE